VSKEVVTWALIGLAGYLVIRALRAPRAPGFTYVQQVRPDYLVGQGAAASGMTWEWDGIEGAWNQRPQVYL
jgi:hypothetical protein